MSNIAMCTFFCSLECVQFAAEVSNAVVQFDAIYFFPTSAFCVCVCVCVFNLKIRSYEGLQKIEGILLYLHPYFCISETEIFCLDGIRNL